MNRELPQAICAHLGWRANLKRLEAEKLLQASTPGTYLLREGDEFTKKIEGNLAKEDSFPVRCYVMTFVEKSHKISDRILVQRPNGWAIYNDDLDLQDYQYQELDDIISQVGGVRPFSSKKVA